MAEQIKVQTKLGKSPIYYIVKIVRHYQRISEKSRDNETAGELRKAG